jgi:DNA-directed RNA polymerase specialized sigma24 family protein
LKIADRLAWNHCRVARREVHLDEETWSQVEPQSDLAGPHEEASSNESKRELGNRADDLAAQYRRASQDEKEKLMKEVVETVNKHFEVRQQRRKLTLDRMQKELERLRGEIEHRNSLRETLVKGRVQELIGDGGPGF